jgi:dGTPase
MRYKKEREEIIDQGLMPFAVKNGESKGRNFPEEDHPYRLCFERDRERIIHSTAWRRLEYKTQVFLNHEGDHFRTRMTHTVEVATISRVIANALGLNSDLAESIALAHDLGHTPFGHSGEEVLDKLLTGKGGFEHNNQSLRVVELLEVRYPDFSGLNLSYETLEGIIKHESRYDNPSISLFSGADHLPNLEAQIVNIADEITYTCHDFDDGIYSGLIGIEDLKREIPLISMIIDQVTALHVGRDEEMQRKQVVRSLINYQVTDLR